MMTSRAQRVIACCRTLATFTEEPGRTTRTFLSSRCAMFTSILASG